MLVYLKCDIFAIFLFFLFVTGVLMHTDTPHGKIPYIYTDVKQIPHDSNLTMNIILNTLIKNKDRLGRVLFLQLDNCFRENKKQVLIESSFPASGAPSF